jgi:phage terminase large subunit-like protein
MEYIRRALNYARSAQHDGKHGKRSKQACKRFLDDLRRARQPDSDFVFNCELAEDPCWFVEQMPHVEGTWDDPLIKLDDSWIFFIVNVFGFRKRSDGTRRFSNAVWCSGRKNAKSTVLAPLGLYCMLADDEMGAKVLSAATTGDQARLIWNIAKAMVDMTPDLQEEFNCKTFANSIVGYDNNSVFKPINALASNQDGLNPYAVLIDEIHAHKNGDLINVLKSATGGRAETLFLFVTTEGYNLGDAPWPELRQFGFQVLDGVVKAEHFFYLHFSIDEDDDIFDESCWPKANPLMGVNPYLLPEMRKLAIEAKHMPGKRAEFKVKKVNIPSESASSFVNLEHWSKCGQQLEKIDDYFGKPCWAAVDLSATRDLTSVRLLFEKDDGGYVTFGFRYAPKEGVYHQTQTGTKLYGGWIEEGYLIQTKGRTIDQPAILEKILWIKKKFKLIKLAVDEWNAIELITKLESARVPFEIFRQGSKSYHPAIKKFEEVYVNEELNHNNDPILNWCADNLVVKYDDNANMKPDKAKSKNKIDDIVTLIMCFGMAIKYKKPKSFDDIIGNITSVKL